MALLSKLLEDLRTRFSDQHGGEYAALLDLNARLEKQDEHLIGELEALLAGQEVRRAEIHRLMGVLAARVGMLPPATTEPRRLMEPDAIDALDAPAGPMPKIVDDVRRQVANGHYAAHAPGQIN